MSGYKPDLAAIAWAASSLSVFYAWALQRRLRVADGRRAPLADVGRRRRRRPGITDIVISYHGYSHQLSLISRHVRRSAGLGRRTMPLRGNASPTG
jgi:hypothetical protein